MRRRRAASRWYPSSAAGTAASRGVDVALRLLALGRHQVEDAAEFCSGPAVTDTWLDGDAGLGHLDLEAEPLDEGVLGQLLALVDRRGGSRGGQRPAVEVDPLGEPVGERSGSRWSCPAMPA